MIASDLTALLRVPGRLVVAPSDLTIAFPYGGTYLGLVMGIAVSERHEMELLREEMLGFAVPDGLELGEFYSLVAVVRDVRQGQAPNLFVGTETGAATGEAGAVVPSSTYAPGTALSARNTTLLFAPLDELSHWFVFFTNACPRPVDGDRDLDAVKEFGKPVRFLAFPRASDGVAVRWKPKADMVLT